jgi:hypothetical protein
VVIVERTKKYAAIESLRKRPLIVYATSTRIGVPAQMAGDVVREFVDQIEAIKEGKSIDVLIHSTGGDALTAWKLMSMLRERFDSVSVLVPYMAFSAATIFALGADEIVMHPHASLGPIDPQITIRQSDGGGRRFSFEDVGAFLRFVNDEVKVTDQNCMSGIVEKLFTVVDPVSIGGAKRASELSTDVGERLLRMHMKDGGSARKIAEALNKSFFAHGDAVSRSRARELQLAIGKDDQAVEALIWDAYLGLEAYMEARTPFNPLHHYMVNGGAATLVAKSPLNLPPNAPQQLVNQIWGQAAQNALNAMAQPALEVPYDLVSAIVESQRLASEFRTKGSISAARVAGGEIKLTATDKEARWAKVPIPQNNGTPA